MNTVDLYNIDSYEDGRLTYNRTKTKDRRQDEGLYFIKLSPEVIPLIKNTWTKPESVFSAFYQMYSTHEIFNAI